MIVLGIRFILREVLWVDVGIVYIVGAFVY